MPKNLPYFRWYPADAETDDFYAGLTNEELGLYHRCLNRSWLNDGIPADPDALAGVLRIPRKQFDRLWLKVSQRWTPSPRDPNKLVNARQEVEYTKAIDKSENNKRVGNANALRTRIEREPNDQQRAYVSVSDAGVLFSLEEKECEKEKPDPQSQWFIAWWQAYWLHKARANAEKAFREAVKTQSTFDAVMSATRAQTPEMAAREPSKRPYGATWLNARRWEDEILPPSNGNGILRKSSGAQAMMDLMAKRIANGQEPL